MKEISSILVLGAFEFELLIFCRKLTFVVNLVVRSELLIFRSSSSFAYDSFAFKLFFIRSLSFLSFVYLYLESTNLDFEKVDHEVEK